MAMPRDLKVVCLDSVNHIQQQPKCLPWDLTDLLPGIC
jgi:hypothetical protein